MKKGKIYTCNGCYAFEESVRTYPLGSPSAATFSDPFCSVGKDIVKQENKYGYKPEEGDCEKPRTITDLVKVKTAFYNECKIKNN